LLERRSPVRAARRAEVAGAPHAGEGGAAG
jgi:hypothetical protein